MRFDPSPNLVLSFCVLIYLLPIDFHMFQESAKYILQWYMRNSCRSLRKKNPLSKNIYEPRYTPSESKWYMEYPSSYI